MFNTLTYTFNYGLSYKHLITFLNLNDYDQFKLIS